MGTDYCSSPHYSYVSHPCETHVASAFESFRYSRETRPRDVRRLSSSETSAVVVSVDVWIRRLFSHASHASLGERGGEIDAHSFHGSLRRRRVDEAVRVVVVVVVVVVFIGALVGSVFPNARRETDKFRIAVLVRSNYRRWQKCW